MPAVSSTNLITSILDTQGTDAAIKHQGRARTQSYNYEQKMVDFNWIITSPKVSLILGYVVEFVAQDLMNQG
ncbi:hypothetical protein L1987_81528 [Smallanthus sonchifolius]|uniref:Uncharacterized protein n=1 Tax=Smallanthus sonchifolius TaxID=185202 RepID=A0ACB8YRY2_9ASTR|nr:hypothetical protein L1987_81528 [Smallanthus sonchifolius]